MLNILVTSVVIQILQSAVCATVRLYQFQTQLCQCSCRLVVLCNAAHLQDDAANLVQMCVMAKTGDKSEANKVLSKHLLSLQIQKNHESSDQQETAACGTLPLKCDMFCNNNIHSSTKTSFRKQVKLNLKRQYIWGIFESENSLDERRNKVGKDIFETQTQSYRNGSVL